jgi:uncharacterized protein (DUF1330 family)
MAKAYWIATYRAINDPEALAAYAKLAGPAIWAAGGRNLVRGNPAKRWRQEWIYGPSLLSATVLQAQSRRTGAQSTRPPGNYWAEQSNEISGSSKARSRCEAARTVFGPAAL